MKSWMHTELEFLSLGDKRRTDRFRRIVETAVAHPTASIPQAQSSWYDTKATYQFWNSPKVTTTGLLQAIGAATARRAADYATVLVIHDTSNINFSASSAPGLGYLDHGRGKGMLAHSSLVVTPQGVPLGLGGQHLWVRPFEQIGKKATRARRPIEQKESWRWVQGVQQTESVLAGVPSRVHLADREADIYQLFAQPRASGAELLVRAIHNRSLVDGGRLWDHLSERPVQGTLDVELQKANGAPARTAHIQLRWQTVSIRPPAGKHPAEPVRLQALLASEVAPPKGVNPVCWKLLTTLAVDTPEDALRIVGWYTHRWLIERFHYVLKSGCRIEQLQLRTLQALQKAVVSYSLVAYRLMWLVYESRACPDAGCDRILEPSEWRALYSWHHRSFAEAEQVPTLGEAVVWIAMLGGFLNRKGDGHPGIKNLWRGMRRLQDLTEMWIVFENGTYQQADSFG